MLDTSSFQLIDTAQTARLLSISPRHLKRLARAGKIPAPLRIGGRKLAWRASDIEALVTSKVGAA